MTGLFFFSLSFFLDACYRQVQAHCRLRVAAARAGQATTMSSGDSTDASRSSPYEDTQNSSDRI